MRNVVRQIYSCCNEICEAVIENRSRHTDRLYTYRCADDIRIGQVVKVPFSKGDTKRRGFVFEIMDDCDLDESKLKEISSVQEDISLTEEMVRDCRMDEAKIRNQIP